MQTPSPLKAASNDQSLASNQTGPELVYAGFWLRLAAFMIDYLILLPLSFVVIYLGHRYRLFSFWYFIPGILIHLWFDAFLVYRYGGTPGKLLLKIRIAMADGSRVTRRAALLRYSVYFVLSTLSSIGALIAILRIPEVQYYSLDYLDQGTQLLQQAPIWCQPVSILLNIWIWSEFISLWFNRRRQALQDLMAGTIVINKPASRSV